MRYRSCYPVFLAVLMGALLPVSAQEEYSSTTEAAAPASESSFSLQTTTTEVVEADVEESPGFFFQGGYGYLPELVSSLGEGVDLLPPIDFDVTVKQGYNDNVYSRADKKGSFTTEMTLGVNVLLSRARTFLNLSARAGGVYYWSEARRPLVPRGDLSLSYAYKLTPRLTFTARVSAGYYDQPNLTIPNTTVLINGGDYFIGTSLFDLTYRWTPLFSTTTSLQLGTQLYRESRSQSSDYFSFTIGQVFRYIYSPVLSGVLDLRYGETYFDDSTRNSQSEYILLGADYRWTSRLSASLRGGVQLRQYDLAGTRDVASPYFEASLGYRYGRGSFLHWVSSFGFEQGYVSQQSNQSLRTGLYITQVLTPRINGRIGGSYSFQILEGLAQQSYTYHQHLITGTAGLDFVVSRAVTLFANYDISSVIYEQQRSADYVRNQVSVGARFRF
ncbi:MAG TPA: outer membrane beta-barrel protein [Chthoniobacteraceae bacterium]|nr:outer membrane beta-barrel protein [Chthoniobacteraceae bacterium]